MSALDGPSGMPPAPAERAGTALTTAERRILDALDEQAMTALLVDLVRVPSVTGSDAESSLQHDLGRLLIAEGLDVDAWAVDLEALRADPQFPGSEAERTEASLQQVE